MTTIQQIIDQAYALVPNQIETSEKVRQLNALNEDFFNVVKIPKIARFTSVANKADYVLDADIRAKNIDDVKLWAFKYRDLDTKNVQPFENTYIFDDETYTLTLSPAPYQNGQQGTLRYHRIATTTFTVGGVATQTPDAPEEYHWTFVPALASWLAKTQVSLEKAENYEQEYKAAWNVAAQNYQKGR